jgi:hypothetical protein
MSIVIIDTINNANTVTKMKSKLTILSMFAVASLYTSNEGNKTK